MDAGAVGVALFVLAVVVGALLLWRQVKRRGAEADQVRRRQAQARGWQYDGRARGITQFAIRGGDATLAWTFQYEYSGVSDSPTTTSQWSTTDRRARDMALLIIGRERHESWTNPLGRALLRYARGQLPPIGRALFARLEDFTRRARPVATGSADFRRRFTVLAHDPSLAHALIDGRIEELLLRSPRRSDPGWRSEHVASVWLDEFGLRVQYDADLTEIHEIDHVVALGLALAGRCPRSAPQGDSGVASHGNDAQQRSPP